jgi:SAM-dependent methyltransferase
MASTERLPGLGEVAVEPLAGDRLTTADLHISATARGVVQLDRFLTGLARRAASRPPGSLLDLGCAMGGLTGHIGRRLGISELIGVDVDPQRVEVAAQRGVRAHVVDLNSQHVPLDDASVDLVTCFGVLAYLRLYDNVLTETGRVLRPGGWFLLSMPNLASYPNRLRLLLGRQPEAVEVSHGRREPQLHSATLHCMTEVLTGFGFEVVSVAGFSPDSARHRLGMVDPLVRRFPSLSRRFVILARNSSSP